MDRADMETVLFAKIRAAVCYGEHCRATDAVFKDSGDHGLTRQDVSDYPGLCAALAEEQVLNATAAQLAAYLQEG